MRTPRTKETLHRRRCVERAHHVEEADIGLDVGGIELDSGQPGQPFGEPRQGVVLGQAEDVVPERVDPPAAMTLKVITSVTLLLYYAGSREHPGMSPGSGLDFPTMRA
jgi:hypothetical protein